MKTTFGSAVERLLRNRVVLMPVEATLLVRLVEAVPDELRSIAEAQFESYNLVQREVDGRALNFYRFQGGRVRRDDLPHLPVKLGEVKLLSARVDVAGLSETVHATMTAVDRHVFCVSLSRALKPFRDCRDVTLTKVTQSWRSALTASPADSVPASGSDADSG